MSNLWIDHVIYAVADLERAGEQMLEEHGLASVPGGRHAAWGTENRIVPLGREYLELVAVADPAQAAASDFGARVAEAAAAGDRLLGWVLATDDLDRVAARLGLEIATGSRTRPDGATLRWRLAGIEAAMDDGGLPFFVQWDVPAGMHPGAAAAPHRLAPGGIAWLEVAEGAAPLAAWLGGCQLPLRLTRGTPGLAAAAIATDDGEIVLR